MRGRLSLLEQMQQGQHDTRVSNLQAILSLKAPAPQVQVIPKSRPGCLVLRLYQIPKYPFMDPPNATQIYVLKYYLPRIRTTRETILECFRKINLFPNQSQPSSNLRLIVSTVANGIHHARPP